MSRRRTTSALVVLLALTGLCALLGQTVVGPTIAQLAYRSSPADTDMFPTLAVGATRATRTTRADLRSGLALTSRNINTTAPLSGGGSLAADLTLAIANQVANCVLAGPTSGGTGAVLCRALVLADFPAGLITYAKLQNVSASPRLLGRSTAGAGSIEELAVGSGLSLTSGTLSATGTGTVSSVGLSLPAFMTVSGSPVTTTGTLTGALASQAAGTIFGNNTGGSAAPTFFNISALDHNALTNLATGDVHTQYVAKGGRSGGQTVNGGTGVSEQLTLHGSTNGTSGGVVISGGDPLYLAGSNGQYWAVGQASELVTLNGTPKDTVGNLLPANAVIQAVVVRIITGASGSCSAFNIGDPTTPARFAASTAVTTGTTVVGLAHVDQTGAAGPRQTSATTVRFTCVSGTLTGGSARVTVFYDQFVAPSS